jgi:hypothetical protein
MADASVTPVREARIYVDGRFEVREVDNPDSWLSTTAPVLVEE